MIGFLFIVFFVCFICALHDFKNRNLQLFLFFLIGILLIFAAGFREGWRDYEEYIRGYENIISGSDANFEISFVILSIINNFLFGNIITLFFIYAIIAISLKTYAIKTLTPLIFLSLLIYISDFYLLHELTQIRAGVSTAFLLLAIKPIYERNFKQFLLYFLLAFLFHYSALIMLLIWFLNKKIRTLYLALIIPFSYLLYLKSINIIILGLPIPLIQHKLAIYQNLQEAGLTIEVNVFNLVFISRIFIFYIILLNRKILEKTNKYFNTLINIYALSLFCFPAFAFIPVFSFRLSELFRVVEIILIPLLYYLFKPKFIAKIIVIIIALSLLLINIFYNKLIY